MAQPEHVIDASVRVLFGAGIRHSIAVEAARLGATKALVLATPQ